MTTQNITYETYQWAVEHKNDDDLNIRTAALHMLSTVDEPEAPQPSVSEELRETTEAIRTAEWVTVDHMEGLEAIIERVEAQEREIEELKSRVEKEHAEVLREQHIRANVNEKHRKAILELSAANRKVAERDSTILLMERKATEARKGDQPEDFPEW